MREPWFSTVSEDPRSGTPGGPTTTGRLRPGGRRGRSAQRPVGQPLAVRYERPITIAGRPGASAPGRPPARPWRRGAERSIRVPAPTWLPFTAVAARPGVPPYAETSSPPRHQLAEAA